MRRILIATLTTVVLTGPSIAQDVSLPTFTFPQPGTFCGPLQLCEPLTTRDAQK